MLWIFSVASSTTSSRTSMEWTSCLRRPSPPWPSQGDRCQSVGYVGGTSSTSPPDHRDSTVPNVTRPTACLREGASSCTRCEDVRVWGGGSAGMQVAILCSYHHVQ